eukprot:TRINITY_DN4427_c0_g1_i2.p1 TRINITY_DN4427_c0_g1~~TRINITY_DN4427_c0_g1_i2.p1  ORF type:complete len:114 (+),score=18.47 TRINITY_DN4427_c0_g1_i2:8-349(+)
MLQRSTQIAHKCITIPSIRFHNQLIRTMAGRGVQIGGVRQDGKTQRWYEEVTVEPSSKFEGFYTALLDGKPLLTHAENPMIVPTKELAAGIAAEWTAQSKYFLNNKFTTMRRK